MIEWIGAKLIGGSELVVSLATWADGHPLVAVPVGIFLLKILDQIVKATPTKYDDLCLGIFTDAIKSAFAGLQDYRKRVGKSA